MAGSNDFRLLEVIVGAGAEVNAQTITGQTPLHLAAQSVHIQNVLFLLRSGALPNLTDNAGLTPLAYAIRENRIEITKLLRVQ